jgi:nucleotidyltransferase/DNA polymerase involved in DNA repair
VLQHVEDAMHLLPTIGIASNKFTAQHAARQPSEPAGRIVIVPDGQERRFLGPLPLSVLPDLPAEMSRRLYLFGITTLGGLAQLPHAAVTLQFGSEWAVYHDLARGIDPRPLTPQMPPPSISRTLTPLEPIHDRAMLLVAGERLAARIAQRLSETGYHALALSVSVATATGDASAAGASVKPPSSDAEQLRRLSGRLVGKLTVEADVIRVTVTAYPLREWHQSARQLTLLDAPLQASLVRLQTAIKVLKQRFGEAVIRLATLIGPPVPLAIKVKAQPDGSPITLSWGGWSRQVKTVWNSWREQSQWWDQPVVRDYYQIEVSDGTLYTVFRDDRGGWFMDRRRR